MRSFRSAMAWMSSPMQEQPLSCSPGSVRDQDVIAAADERGLAMVFTGRRHFRH